MFPRKYPLDVLLSILSYFSFNGCFQANLSSSCWASDKDGVGYRKQIYEKTLRRRNEKCCFVLSFSN